MSNGIPVAYRIGITRLKNYMNSLKVLSYYIWVKVPAALIWYVENNLNGGCFILRNPDKMVQVLSARNALTVTLQRPPNSTLKCGNRPHRHFLTTHWPLTHHPQPPSKNTPETKNPLHPTNPNHLNNTQITIRQTNPSVRPRSGCTEINHTLCYPLHTYCTSDSHTYLQAYLRPSCPCKYQRNREKRHGKLGRRSQYKTSNSGRVWCRCELRNDVESGIGVGTR